MHLLSLIALFCSGVGAGREQRARNRALPGLNLIDVVCCDMNSLTRFDGLNGRWPGLRCRLVDVYLIVSEC